jgi:hypothetical protein
VNASYDEDWLSVDALTYKLRRVHFEPRSNARSGENRGWGIARVHRLLLAIHRIGCNFHNAFYWRSTAMPWEDRSTLRMRQ